MPTLPLFDCYIFFHIPDPGFHGNFIPAQGPLVAVALLRERWGAPDELLRSVVATENLVAARILAVGWSLWTPPFSAVIEPMISRIEQIKDAPSQKEGGGLCYYRCRSGWGGCGGFDTMALEKLEKLCMMHIHNFNEKVVYWYVTYGEPH